MRLRALRERWATRPRHPAPDGTQAGDVAPRSMSGGLPIDRGLAFVRSHADGTRSVMICCGVENGAPMHVFAVHSRQTSIEIDPRIEWVVAGPSSRYTTGMVIVSAVTDGVRIQRPPADPGPLADEVGE